MSDTNTRAKVQEQPAQQQGENQDKDQDLELALPLASVIATSTMIPKPSTRICTLVGCVLFLVFGGIFVGALIDYISTPREKSWSQLPDLTVVDHKPKASPTSDVDLIYMVVFGVLAFTTALVFPLIYMAVRSRRKALFHMQELVDNGQALTIFAGDLQWTSYVQSEWGPSGRQVARASWPLIICAAIIVAPICMVIIKVKDMTYASRNQGEESMSWGMAAAIGCPSGAALAILFGLLRRWLIVAKRRQLYRAKWPLVLCQGGATFAGLFVGPGYNSCFGGTQTIKVSKISMVDGFYALTIDWFQAGKNNQESKSFRAPVPKDKLELVDRQLRDWPLFHYKGIVA